MITFLSKPFSRVPRHRTNFDALDFNKHWIPARNRLLLSIMFRRVSSIGLVSIGVLQVTWSRSAHAAPAKDYIAVKEEIKKKIEEDDEKRGNGRKRRTLSEA
jgi:hypothetical protein